MATLGENEWSIKLVSIFCSILSAFLLWFLVGAMGKRAAAFVVAIFVTLPMELHYGDVVYYEPCLVMWMLAALICLRNWDRLRTSRWAILAALCCGGALWTDWPGYLFTGAVAIWLLFNREKQSRRLALLLLALAVSSGILFLLQIHRVNPEGVERFNHRHKDASTPAPSPARRKVSSSEVRFGFWEWVRRILQALDQDYLRVTWALVLAGAIYLFRQRKFAGPRSLGWAALLMAAAGIPYLAILRNWSYVHDFASFSSSARLRLPAAWPSKRSGNGPSARAALEFCAGSRPLERRCFFRPLPGWLHPRPRTTFAVSHARGGGEREPANLIRDLAVPSTVFPAETTILCNFDLYYSPLSYYAQRTIIRNVTTADEWKSAIETKDEDYGGVIWLDAPTAPEIRATLPGAEISETEIDGVRFAIWRRSTR